MTMASNWTPSYLSALLDYQNTQSMLGLPSGHSPMDLGNTTLSNNVDTSSVRLRNSILLSHLAQQQQAEEQQRILLAQQLNALGGFSRNQAFNALPESQRLLAILRLQEQEQILMRQRRLHELQAALMLPGGNMSSITSMNNVQDSLVSSPAPSSAQTTNPAQQSSSNGDVAVGRNLDRSVSEKLHAKKDVTTGDNDAVTVPHSRKRKGRSGTFPQKLHQMLSDLEREEGGSSIASFFPHGRAFAIHKPREFANSVMPKYFRMSRFSSFQRQLNLYDFQRITEGSDKGAYYHELFVEDRPFLCTTMKRNKIKGVKRNAVENGLNKPANDDSQDEADSAHDNEEDESAQDD